MLRGTKSKWMAMVLVLAVLLTVLLAGCACSGSSSKVSAADAAKMAGTWQLTGAEYDGVKLTAQEVGSTMSFTFRENGKVTYTFDGQSEDYDWEIDDDLITIWVPIEGGLGSKEGHTAVLEGNSFTLYWDYEGKPMQMYYSKK